MVEIKKSDKDRLAVILPIAIIFLLGIAFAKIDKIFPTPSATGKVIEIANMVNYTHSNYSDFNPDAKVTIIEFSDFKCSACAMAAPEFRKVHDEYGDEVNVVFKHFPMQAESAKAAQAAECARDQNKFWEYHDLLFMNQMDMAVNDLEEYAHILGLDTIRFGMCLSSGMKRGIIEEDFRLGAESKVPGTPTFFINGKMISGAQPFSQLKEMIDAELEK